jgi:hypothetical protein
MVLGSNPPVTRQSSYQPGRLSAYLQLLTFSQTYSHCRCADQNRDFFSRAGFGFRALCFSGFSTMLSADYSALLRKFSSYFDSFCAGISGRVVSCVLDRFSRKPAPVSFIQGFFSSSVIRFFNRITFALNTAVKSQRFSAQGCDPVSSLPLSSSPVSSRPAMYLTVPSFFCILNCE